MSTKKDARWYLATVMATHAGLDSIMELEYQERENLLSAAQIVLGAIPAEKVQELAKRWNDREDEKIVIEIQFEREVDEYDSDYDHLNAKTVSLHPDTTLDEGDIEALGEEIGQSDRWQVDNWNAIQRVLGGVSKSEPLK
jgi:hypothetical protein